MEIQHANVKMFVAGELKTSFEDIIKVFHQWTAEQVMPELLIDVADYLHVPEGPGVVLVGHEADYAIDNAQGRWGLLYNRKSKVEGSNQQILSQAFSAASHACHVLEGQFPDGLQFDRTEFQIVVNDRSFVPNTPESFAALQDDLKGFVQAVSGSDEFEFTQDSDPRRRRVDSRMSRRNPRGELSGLVRSARSVPTWFRYAGRR